MSNQIEPVSGSPQPERATAATDTVNPPATATAVAHLIIATHRTIAAAHQHGRRQVGLVDHLISRVQFRIARRLARLAWRIAEAGRRRVQ